MRLARRNIRTLLIIALFAVVAMGTALPGRVTRAQAQAGWASYLATLIKDKATVKYGAIYGLDGAKWAATLDANPGEIANIVAGLQNKDRFISNGIIYGGVKYMYLRNRYPDGVTGKKGPTTILIRQSTKAVVIVLSTDGANPANITSLDFVVDDLKKKKF